MQVVDVMRIMEDWAPLSWSQPWDNCGLLVGDPAQIVQSALICLEVTDRVIDEALAQQVQLIISHHPLIFHPLRAVINSDIVGGMVMRLMKYGISLYSAHTNLDAAPGGVNDVLAGLLGLQASKPIRLLPDGPEHAGLGRIGGLPERMQPQALAEMVTNKLHAPVRLASAEKSVERVAVWAGSWERDALEDVRCVDAQAIITGDIGHHDALDALARGISVIQAGHAATEQPAVGAIFDYLQSHGNALHYKQVKWIASGINTCPFYS